MTKQLNHSHKLGDIFYRATPHGYDFSSRGKAIEYEQWEVVKLTPKGVWLSKKNLDPDKIMYDYERDKHFALTPGAKWVSPTKKEAVLRLMTRRVNQLKILQSQISIAKQEYDLAFEAFGKLDDTGSIEDMKS